MTAELPKRIQLIDAIRGLCVVLMVVHHLMYDLVWMLGAPIWLFKNPVFDVLHYIFAGTFIFLSGVSSLFSRSNVKRGLKCIAAAVVITVVTYFLKNPIWFGILHFLGFCMVFYGLTAKLWDKIPRAAAPFIYIALLVASAILIKQTGFVEAKWLWPFGFKTATFYSADYFPILPWVFVFLLGTWAGKYIRDGKMPRWFYTVEPKLFPSIGRKAFIVYLVHQPVLYGVVLLIKLIFFRHQI